MEEDLDDFGELVSEEYSESSDNRSEEEWEDYNNSGNEAGDAEDPVLYDTQSIHEPLVKIQTSTEDELAAPNNWDYQIDLAKQAPGLVRSFAIVGNTNSGKTSLADSICTEASLNVPPPRIKQAVSKQMSKIRPTLTPTYSSVLAQNSRGKTFVLNVADTPGHPDFRSEAKNAEKICDGVIRVVNVVEGPIYEPATTTEQTVMVFNQLDKLILDLRLPPTHAFRRIKELANNLGRSLDSIVFTSCKFKFAFTLESIRAMYRHYNNSVDSIDLAEESEFVRYILQPIYTLVGSALIGEKSQAKLESSGIELTPSEWKLDYDDRISILLSRYFENGFKPLIDTIVSAIPKFELVAAEETCAPQVSTVLIRGSELWAVERAHEELAGEDLNIPYGLDVIKSLVIPCGMWFMRKYHGSATAEPAAAAGSSSALERSHFKVEIEPREMTMEAFKKLGTGVRLASAVFSALHIESTEKDTYVLESPGEFYTNEVLKFLRNQGFRYKVGHPSVSFRETVSSKSHAALPTQIGNNGSDGRITVIASPSSDDLSDYYQWHLGPLNCSLWGTVPKTDVDENVLKLIVEGFLWYTERGPLLEEPMSNVAICVKRLEISRAAHQITAAMHRACNAATLLASPRLEEPLCKVIVIGRLAAGRACYSELDKRGGEVVRDEPIRGTNLYRTEGSVKLIDSLGLKVDILCKLESKDMAHVTVLPIDWTQVTGDPLDTSQQNLRLKPAGPEARARDFMLKTRKAKSLSQEPQLDQYVDKEILPLLQG